MGSQLSRISNEVQLLPPRIVIHSEGGAGKTTLAASVPGVVIIPVEDGLGTLKVPHFEQPKSFVDVMNCLSELYNEKHSYKAVAIDTIDKVEPLIWDRTCETKSNGRKYESIEDFGYQKGYTFADPFWIELFRSFDALRRDRHMTCIILCHNERRSVDDPLIGPHDRIHPKLHKRANALLYEWADVVGFLDIEKVADEKAGKHGKSTRTALSTGQRQIHLEDRGSFTAKNRYSLPPTIQISKDNPYKPLRDEIAARFAVKKEAA